MATWICRGMEMFLSSEFGLDDWDLKSVIRDNSLVLKMGGGDNIFLNREQIIFRVMYHFESEKVEIWIYNIRENLPWKKLSQMETNLKKDEELFPDLCGAQMYGDDIFIFFSIDDNIQKQYVPIYSISEDAWTLPVFEDVMTENDVNSLIACRSGNLYYTLSFNYWNLYEMLRESLSYVDDGFIPPFPIVIHVFNFDTQEWLELETTFEKYEFRLDEVEQLRQGLAIGRFVPGPESQTLHVMATYDYIFRLDTKNCKWSRIETTGRGPNVIMDVVRIDDYDYVYGHDSGMYRFDPRLCHWEIIRTMGKPPKLRVDVTLLAIDARIVFIGGFHMEESLPLSFFKNGFWFRPKNFNRRCCCNFCRKMKLAPAQGCCCGFRQKRSDNVLTKLFRRATLSMGLLRQLRREEIKELKAEDFIQWIHWLEWRFLYTYDNCTDLHILDLEPTLLTLCLMKIADIPALDISLIPPCIHLNLNTMYAFHEENLDPSGLTKKDRQLLRGGKFEARHYSYGYITNRAIKDGSLLKHFFGKLFDKRCS